MYIKRSTCSVRPAGCVHVCNLTVTSVLTPFRSYKVDSRWTTIENGQRLLGDIHDVASNYNKLLSSATGSWERGGCADEGTCSQRWLAKGRRYRCRRARGEGGVGSRMIKPPRDGNFSCPIINYRAALGSHARCTSVLRVTRKISAGIIISYVNYALIYYPAPRDVLIIILPGPRGQLEK